MVETDGAPLLGGIAYRLYAADAPSPVRATRRREFEGWTPIAAHSLELDPSDPWALGFASSHFWRTLATDKLTPLVERAAKLRGENANLTWCDAVDAPLPVPRLSAMPLTERGDPIGGLIVQLPRAARAAKAAVDLIENPRSRERLRLEIALEALRRERAELAGFREAVGQALPYGTLILDPLGRVLHCGGRAEAILGVRAEDARGLDCVRVFRTVGLEDRHPLLEALKGRAAPIELYLARPDGTEAPISLQTAPLAGPGRKRRGLVAFFRDLSEERVLAESRSQRDRLIALGELSAGMAHEIRNPLTGIANCAQVLKEGRIGEEQRERFLDLILDEAERLNRIVEGLLSYARPNRPELRESDILESVRRVLELQGPTMAEAGVRSSLVVRGRIPRLYVDPNQIEQVLLNLVRNAQEAMPEGGDLRLDVAVIRRLPHQRRMPGRRATDRVRYARDPLRARFLQIRVADTGRGISKEHLSRIWNPFFTTRTRGTGLGLSLSLAIVREHGGTLAARSVEHKGTTILMDLPIERRQGERRQDA